MVSITGEIDSDGGDDLDHGEEEEEEEDPTPRPRPQSDESISHYTNDGWPQRDVS